LGGSCDKTPTPVPRRHQHTKPTVTAAEHLCPVCGGRFTQPSDLAVHLSKIHSVKAEVADMATDGGAADQLALPLTSLADNLALQLYREHDLHTSPALSVK